MIESLPGRTIESWRRGIPSSMRYLIIRKLYILPNALISIAGYGWCLGLEKVSSMTKPPEYHKLATGKETVVVIREVSIKSRKAAAKTSRRWVSTLHDSFVAVDIESTKTDIHSVCARRVLGFAVPKCTSQVSSQIFSVASKEIEALWCPLLELSPCLSGSASFCITVPWTLKAFMLKNLFH